MSSKKLNPPTNAAALEPRAVDVKPANPPVTAPAPTALKPPPLFRRIDWITFWTTTLLVLIGYLWTLAPDLTLEDSGELAVGSFYAGVPHPPGYPIWTIYSWLFTVLFPVSNIAYRVAVSSAVAGALSCGLLALMVSRGSSMMIEGIPDLKNIDRRVENGLCFVAGFVGGLLFGFNGFMWSQAVIVEVYTLSVLSLTGVLCCLLRWVYAPHQRRYLYLAFFLYGICFNNHQSLLVIALGMEVLMIAVQPKLGRELIQWNVLIYIGGLVGKSMGLLSVLSDNTPLFTIYNFIGIASFLAYGWLVLKTQKSIIELGRDGAMVVSLAYLVVLFGKITHYTVAFDNKGGLFFLFNVFGLAAIGAFIWLIPRAKAQGNEWVAALICGLAWTLGALFYLYMPLASMTNPPMNWGYPRTVTGFFHAFTRGQYERIHPSTDFFTYCKQVWMYIDGALEEFNFAYLAIGLVPFAFYRRMQRRERSWLIGLTAMYITLSLFLLLLLNPALDRQSRQLNKVFFTASHVVVAMGIGYGLTLIGALLTTQYERYRRIALISAAAASGLALFWVAHVYQKTPQPLVHITALVGLFLGLAATAVALTARERFPLRAALIIFAFMPTYSVLAHWSDNEQRGHLFGYWFGHDMFTPPFKEANGEPIYPEMAEDAVLFGGTDPGRFNPTYMIFCESFIPPDKKDEYYKQDDPNFDRRDVYLITQNALADGTYLSYIRAQYFRSAEHDSPFFTELLRGPTEIEQNYTTNWIARAVAPIDSFFTSLGDRIEKVRRAGTSYFIAKDFLDLPALTARLQPGPNQDPVSAFLYQHFSDNTRAILKDKADEDDLRDALALEFNRIIEGPNIYDAERFKNVKLSTHTARFVQQNPKSHTLIRLNRLLLEAAYPTAIAKSVGGLYPDLEIYTPSNEDSQRAFQDYLTDAQRRLQLNQLKPGEDVRVVENKVQVSGQVAVMAINALLTKVIFDHNPNHEFYVEESFPLEWMYPYLTPFGIIMKINRQPVLQITEDMIQKDHRFWSLYSDRLIGNWITYDTPVSNICAFAEKTYYRRDYSGFEGDPKFVRDEDGQKAFSKLRSSIAGIYNWRIQNAKSPAEQQRMLKEADFAFKQAFAFCPYSPEAVFRYVNLLVGIQRFDDAIAIAKTAQILDPENTNLDSLVAQLQAIKQQQGGMANIQAQIVQLQKEYQAHPTNRALGARLGDLILSNPQADPNSILFAVNLFNQVGNIAKVEQGLTRLVQVAPDNAEAWFDLAGVQALARKNAPALQSLHQALALNARRLAANPKAPNLTNNAAADPRFSALRALPEFQKLVAP